MNVKIVKEGNGAYGTHIFLDGQEIHRVSKMTLEHEVGMMPILTLEIIPQTLEIETEADVLECEQEKMDGYKEFIKFLFRGKSS